MESEEDSESRPKQTSQSGFSVDPTLPSTLSMPSGTVTMKKQSECLEPVPGGPVRMRRDDIRERRVEGHRSERDIHVHRGRLLGKKFVNFFIELV